MRAGDETLTYQQLDARASRLAHGLITHGVGPEVRVGLCAPRGIDAVVGMLAWLISGALFVGSIFAAIG